MRLYIRVKGDFRFRQISELSEELETHVSDSTYMHTMLTSDKMVCSVPVRKMSRTRC